MSGLVIQKAFLKRHLQFLIKVPQMTAKLSKIKNLQFLPFLATSRKFKENFIWLGYTQSDEKQIGVWCLLKVFPSEMHNIIQKVSNLFPSNL